MNFKKLLSVLLALVLCLSLASVAYAAEAPSIGDIPSIGDPVDPQPEPETVNPVAPNAGKTPSVGDIYIPENISASAPITVDNVEYVVAAYSAKMTDSALAQMDAKAGEYKWTFATFDLSLLNIATGEVRDGKLPAPVEVDLSMVFGNQVNFGDARVAYTLLHYDTTTGTVEALPVSREGKVTMSSLSPVRLVGASTGAKPEVKPEQPEVKPEQPAPVAPAPVAPQSPKTAESSIAAALFVLAVAAGAGVVLTRERQ